MAHSGLQDSAPISRQSGVEPTTSIKKKGRPKLQREKIPIKPKLNRDTDSVMAKVIDEVARNAVKMNKEPVNLKDEFGKSDEEEGENDLVMDLKVILIFY